MSSRTRVGSDNRGFALVVNETEIPTPQIVSRLREVNPTLASLMEWSDSFGPRGGSLVDRDRYVSPGKLFDQYRLASYAVDHDNVVGNIADTTEQLAIDHVSVQCDDEEQQDVWNQILFDIKADRKFREMWREAFTYSTAIVASRWKTKSYRVKGKTKDGNRRRKQFIGLNVPSAVSMMDPTRVVPVGSFIFGDERLVYIAKNAEEINRLKNSSSPVDLELFRGQYEASLSEIAEIQKETGATIPTGGLFNLNPDRVYRVTATKPDYEKFAAVRMKSVFEFLDLKAQLREMDRAHLMGAASFIVLVKLGNDKYPAQGAEVGQVNEQFASGARIPVVVGDHRIEIEIITPKMEYVLDKEKYRLLDSMIAIRLYQIFHQVGDSSEDPTKLMRVVTSSMEARRDDLMTEFHRNVIMPIQEKNSDQLTEEPKLSISPRRISLSFDPNLATALQDGLTLGPISRWTYLSEVFGLDEHEEWGRRVAEKERDEDFRPVPDPKFETEVKTKVGRLSQQQPAQPDQPNGKEKSGGRTGGGEKGGGGANPASPKSGPGRGPNKPT